MMTKLKTGSLFGNFKWTATTEVSESAIERLAELGLLQIMQRGPSSEAEKVLAGFKKRPEGFKRNSIQFTEDNGETLRKLLSKVTLDGDEVEELPELNFNLEVEVEQYVPTAVDPKFTEEKVIVKNHSEKGDLPEWALVNLKVEVLPATPIEDKEFLGKVREFKKAMLATM